MEEIVNYKFCSKSNYKKYSFLVKNKSINVKNVVKYLLKEMIEKNIHMIKN